MVYQKYDDSAHGWLKVTVRGLKNLGIADKISGYSYLSPSGKWAYLEEDMDLTTFYQAHTAMFGTEPEIKYRYSGDRSQIRNYPPYR